MWEGPCGTEGDRFLGEAHHARNNLLCPLRPNHHMVDFDLRKHPSACAGRRSRTDRSGLGDLLSNLLRGDCAQIFSPAGPIIPNSPLLSFDNEYLGSNGSDNCLSRWDIP